MWRGCLSNLILRESFMSIENILQERQIQYLCHFTRLENLESILTHGLIPRSNLYNAEFNPNPSLSIHGIFNDRYRIDGKPDATSLSISFPNSSMFYGLRCSNNSAQWAVIVLSARVLIDKNCAFYPTNAANSSVNSMPISHFKGVSALNRLFEGDNTNRQYLLDKDPTDVQAEVLVFDNIEPRYIYGAVLKRTEDIENFQSLFPNFTFVKYERWGYWDDRFNARLNKFLGY